MSRYTLAGLALLLVVPASLAQTMRKDVGDRTGWFRNIVIQPDESADDVVCYGCNVRVLGEVRDDVVTMDGSIELEGNVGDDAVAFGGRVHADSNVRIGDEADAFGGYVTADPGAQIPDGGESIFYLFLPGQSQPPLAGFGIVAGAHALFVFLFALILRRRRVESIFETMRRRKGGVLLWGAIGWIVAVALIYASVMIGGDRSGEIATYIVPAIVFLALASAVNSGLTGVSVWLGRAFSRNAGWLGAILIGTIVILLLEVIPLAGFAVFVVAAWLSMGAALTSCWGSKPNGVRRFASGAV